MTDTSSAVVEEMLVPNLPSPAPAPAPVPDADTTLPANGHPLDPDGDVAMQQPSPVLNGLVDVDDPPPPPASTSPYPQEPDDELGRPPAKRPRKYSDADRASLANVCASSLPSFFLLIRPKTASPPPVTASSVQTNGEPVAASPTPASAPSAPLGASTLNAAQHRFCLSIIRSFKKMKEAHAFLRPVDPVSLKIPHYPSIIKNPMDFSTIEKKLMSSNPAKPDPNPNNPRYYSADEFISDFRLVFTNCITFNGPEHPISIAGKHVEALFDKQIKQLPSATPVCSRPVYPKPCSSF